MQARRLRYRGADKERGSITKARRVDFHHEGHEGREGRKAEMKGEEGETTKARRVEGGGVAECVGKNPCCNFGRLSVPSDGEIRQDQSGLVPLNRATASEGAEQQDESSVPRGGAEIRDSRYSGAQD
jgi:hypothetical protein